MSLEDAIIAVQRSQKFQRWELYPFLCNEKIDPCLSIEKHFSPAELAKAWGVSAETIRSLFRSEPGVLKIGNNGARRRGYLTLRIPQEVAERVHRRLSA